MFKVFWQRDQKIFLFPKAKSRKKIAVVFKEESGGCTTVSQSWGKKMYNRFGTKEAPDWWSEALGMCTNGQRKYGKAFKKPASERSKTEKTYAKNTTKRRVALLDGIGLFT